MADEQLTEIDDWLSDLDDEEDGDAADKELSQEDINQLLGGDEEGSAAPDQAPEAGPAADTAEEESAAAPEEAEELSQDDIDSLLGDTAPEEREAAAADGEQPVPDREEEEEAPLDDLPPPESASPPSDEEVSAADLDQSEIDALFASAEGETAAAEEMDIDQLFGGDDTEQPTEPESAPRAPEEEPTVVAPPPTAEEKSPPAGTPATDSEPDKGKRPKWLLPAAVGFGLLLVALGGGWWFFNRSTPPPADQAAQEPAPGAAPATVTGGSPPPPPQPPAANRPPEAVSAVFRLAKAGGALDIELDGRDADGDQLTFELASPPSHGRLSGTPPALTYLPDASFAGEDSFTFVVSDGTATSPPATVYILGQRPAVRPARPVAKAKTKTSPPPPPALKAADVRLTTDSATPLLIDWRTIWRKGNKGRFPGVEISTPAAALHGRLVRITGVAHRYEPPPYWRGEEVIGYRFVSGKRRSSEGLLHIAVRQGDHRPEARVQPLAASYPAGSTVIVDARPSRDDQPERLAFSWRQVSGPPVRLEARNDNQAVVAFVMPSDFSTSAPSVGLTLTVTDASGQKDSIDIVIHGRSRRTAALWNMEQITAR